MANMQNILSYIHDLGQDLCSNFLPIKYLRMGSKFEFIINDFDVNHIIDVLFWIFIALSAGYSIFSKFFQLFLRRFKISYCKQNLAIRSVWNLAFYGASVSFLALYHKYMISPELTDNIGKLFPKYENTIFYKSQHCENFEIYSLIIITFFLHSATQDFRECDINGCVSKLLYSFAILTLMCSRFQNYFVLLNINLGIFYLITECLTLLSLQASAGNLFASNMFLCFRILSWSHMYVNLLPFKYLVPTLFAKNFNLFLNIFIWLWYGMCIWNSPVLQYFYHQIYHNTPIDCMGDGSAARCIMLKDSPDQRHYKALRKAYLEVKLANTKTNVQSMPQNENASAKAFQAIKCVMTLKRKLRRIREGRESPSDDEIAPSTQTTK